MSKTAKHVEIDDATLEALLDGIPLEWRELYAIACYLYLRPGELYELRWRDVDLSVATIHVTRAWIGSPAP